MQIACDFENCTTAVEHTGDVPPRGFTLCRVHAKGRYGRGFRSGVIWMQSRVRPYVDSKQTHFDFPGLDASYPIDSPEPPAEYKRISWEITFKSYGKERKGKAHVKAVPVYDATATVNASPSGDSMARRLFLRKRNDTRPFHLNMLRPGPQRMCTRPTTLPSDIVSCVPLERKIRSDKQPADAPKKPQSAVSFEISAIGARSDADFDRMMIERYPNQYKKEGE